MFECPPNRGNFIMSKTMNVEIGQLWEAATVLLALQATSFGWRINRESAASEKGEPT